MPFEPVANLQPRQRDAWDDLANRHPERGPAGLAHETHGTKEHLLHRDDDGMLQATARYDTVTGKVAIFVDPARRRRGLGMTLLLAAIERWDIQARQQNYTPAGAAMTRAWLAEHRRPTT